MDLRQLECFLKVAEHLHFGRAAEDLYLGQPTVSEAVRRLERELGGALFDRTTRRVTLTPLGASFLEDARDAYRAVVQAYDAGRAAARRDAQELVVGSSGDFGAELVESVAAFHRDAPGVIVTLRTWSTPRQLRALRERKLNAAICWAPDVDTAMFERRTVGASRFAAVVAVDHPLAGRASVALEELAAEPLVGWNRATNPRLYDVLAQTMDATGKPWSFVGAASGIDDVAAHVLSGFGVGIIVESFSLPRPLPDVAVLPITDDIPAVVREVVWRRTDRHPALPAFIEHLVELAQRRSPAAEGRASA